MFPTGKAVRLGFRVGALALAAAVCGCDSWGASAVKAAVAPKARFRAYQVIDQQQGGMPVSRFAVPEDWKTYSKVTWNYQDYYSPVRVSAGAEAPDASAWVDFFPNEAFWWFDAGHDRMVGGYAGVGGIHHYNVSLTEAMVRYVIARNRSYAKNLRIIGSRPVGNLPKAFARLFTPGTPTRGEGICLRVQYQQDGVPVDEEFYGFMPDATSAPSQGPAGLIYEFHRYMFLVHSLAAKNGQLEAKRALLGALALSVDPNPAWSQRLAEIQKAQADYFNQALAAGYDQIRAAGEMSRQISANNDRMIANMDASRAASWGLSRSGAGSGGGRSSGSSGGNDDFDQYIRGTEHMQDQNGTVSDQSSAYNYHWSNGFGQFVHTNDSSYDPNVYLNGNYERMTPAPR